MKRPKQQVFIIEGKKKYAFDAVVKIETTTSLKVAEERGDVKGKAAVNFAVRQPNTVTLEVSVSDTVTVSNEPLTKGKKGSRSTRAHKCLIAMQERRQFLTVITPSYTFRKMLIESITQEYSDDFNFGEFHASIALKEMTVKPKKKKAKYGRRKNKDGTTTRTKVDTSILYDWLKGKNGKYSWVRRGKK